MAGTSLTDPISDQFSKIWGVMGNNSATNPSPMSGSNQEGGWGTGMKAGMAALTGPFSLLFGKSHDGPNPQVGGVNPEPITGDSLTQYLRSLTNQQGVTGEGLTNLGQATLGAGLGTTQAGLNLFQQPVDYFSKLASGDSNLMASAVAPTANAVNEQFDTASKSTSAGMPRSGYRSTAMANMPFQKASQIGNMEETLQPQANSQLAGMAQALAGLGMNEQQIANQLTQMGLTTTAQAVQSLLIRRGQNMSQDTANMGLIASGGSDILKTLV